MGLFSPNPAKLKQIELQNYLFSTNEKKLMVSTEFLNNMTTNYISKRMKNINKMMDGIVVTKNPKNFFAFLENIYHDLEELLPLEKYHTFKDPIPSEFQKILESKIPEYTEAMIKRTWRDASQKIGLNDEGKRDPRLYGPILEEFLNHKDKYTKVQLDLIDKFYKSVYDISFRDIPEPEPEPEVPEEDISENELPEDELVLSSEDSAENDETETETEDEASEESAEEEPAE